MAFKRQYSFSSLKELRDYQSLVERHADYYDDRDSLQSWKKSMFRKSDRWKNYCKYLIQVRGGTCQRCGTNKDLIVHHRDPKNYSNLVDENFVVLCGSCHLKIESWCTTKDKMRMCPNVDKPFLTLYPYQKSVDFVGKKQAGIMAVNKWQREIDGSKMPINRKQSSLRQEDVNEAVFFMKQHPELFC